MNVKDKVAVITGAASGIGRAIATSLAMRGCHLALADIDVQGLKETLEQISKWGVKVSSHILDVTDRAAVKVLPAEVTAAHGGIDILINNAGISAAGTFQQLCEADYDRVIDINFHAVVRITRVFLPYLSEREEARIVNMSSVFGLISPTGQSAYCASKFAVRGFSNVLKHELEDTSIGVSVVHPGGVATNIAKSATISEGPFKEEIRKKLNGQEKLLRMSAEKAGEIIVKGIEKGKGRIIVGSDAKLLSVMERVMPVGYWKLITLMTALIAKRN